MFKVFCLYCIESYLVLWLNKSIPMNFYRGVSHTADQFANLALLLPFLPFLPDRQCSHQLDQMILHPGRVLQSLNRQPHWSVFNYLPLSCFDDHQHYLQFLPDCHCSVQLNQMIWMLKQTFVRKYKLLGLKLYLLGSDLPFSQPPKALIDAEFVMKTY